MQWFCSYSAKFKIEAFSYSSAVTEQKFAPQFQSLELMTGHKILEVF